MPMGYAFLSRAQLDALVAEFGDADYAVIDNPANQITRLRFLTDAQVDGFEYSAIRTTFVSSKGEAVAA